MAIAAELFYYRLFECLIVMDINKNKRKKKKFEKGSIKMTFGAKFKAV